MNAKGDNNNNSLECYENKLQKEKRDSKKALSIAKEILERKLIDNLMIAERGNPPSPLRSVGKGARGELWFRNKLLWLRTIPLENDISFMITHSEPPVYYKGKTGRNSADLLGIWHSRGNTKLGVVELKAWSRSSDHILYAIMEGLRNLHLHRKAIKRLHSGWVKALNQPRQSSEELFWSNVWSKANPFNSNLDKSHLIIIGNNKWIQAQESWESGVREITKEIQEKFNYETSIYSLNGAVKSKPYVLLPLTKWL